MDLITAAEVASILGVTADTHLTLIVTAVNQAATRKRSFERATYTEVIPGFGADVVFLRESPIISVSEVRIDRTGELAADSAADDLTLFKWNTRLEDDDNRLYYVAGRFPEGPRTVQVTYVAGYETAVPDDLRLELIGECIDRYRIGTNERFKSESQGAWSMTRFDGVDPKRRSVFRRYRI